MVCGQWPNNPSLITLVWSVVNLVDGQLFSEQLVGGRCFLRSVVSGSSGRCSVQCFKVSSRWSMDSKVKGDRWSVVSGWSVGLYYAE